MPDNEEKLVKMLKYISEHNDFYKKRIKEYGITNPLDITQWPVLTRKELQENRYNMFSEGYKRKYFSQQLRRQSSSGSTGMPVNVYWDYKDWYASNMCLWRKRRGWYGIKPGDKYCVFTLNAFGIIPEEGKLYFINDPSNILSFNVSLIRDESGYEQIAEKINEFKPVWLYIQPFVLTQLISSYRKLSVDPPETIRYIESVGEILTSDLRKRAEELFHVPVTNMYGSEEMNGIAIEDHNGEMHVLTDNIFLEVNNESGISQFGEGESIITNLNNFAMPLIRYDQGDECKIHKDYQFFIIHSITGRTFCEPSGRYTMNTMFLSDSIADINNQFFDCINSYSLKFSVNSNSVICHLNVDKNYKLWEKVIEKKIIEKIKKHYPDINVCVLFTDSVMISKNKIIVE